MKKSRGRPFEAGNTFGRGRPKGRVNKMTALWQQLQDEFGEQIVKKCMSLAVEGDRAAMRLCMERMIAPRRDSSVQFELASIKDLTGIEAAMDAVLKRIASGRMTPEQGETVSRILETQRRIVESRDLDARMEKLEEVDRAHEGELK